MQSLYLFMNEKKLEYGIRCSLENFGVFKNELEKTIQIFPLYVIGNIVNT